MTLATKSEKSMWEEFKGLSTLGKITVIGGIIGLIFGLTSVILGLISLSGGGTSTAAILDGPANYSEPKEEGTALVGVTKLFEGMGVVTDLDTRYGDDAVYVTSRLGQVFRVPDRYAYPYIWYSTATNPVSGSGLLGIAFHPSGSSFFLSLNLPEQNGEKYWVLQEIPITPLGYPAPDQVVTHLQTRQFANTNQSGWIGFGPDGYLYVTMGNGGNPDPAELYTGATPYGKLLRINAPGNGTIAPVDGNPGVGTEGFGPYILTFGFTDPWRCFFDGTTLLIGDNVVREGVYYSRVYEWNTAKSPPSIAQTTVPLFEVEAGIGSKIILGAKNTGQVDPVTDQLLYANTKTTQLYLWDGTKNGTVADVTLPGGAMFMSQIRDQVWIGTNDGTLYRLE